MLAPAPDTVSLAEESTVLANALTAALALDELGLTGGQSLAITGAAGAVGGYAVELVRTRGLLGIASPPDEPFLAERGAQFVPREQDPAAAVRRAAPAGVDCA